jgi:Asp-tRNA(Asn)/Glu-tRNA(Gln) amidotransferase A subunit family amidase
MTEGSERRTARDIRDAIVRGETSAREVLKETLDRIDRLDGRLHSFLTVAAEHANQQVDELERRRRAGENPGPLWGVPFSVKDLYDTRGVRTTYGSRAFADHVPDEDAVLVERIRRAGGILVGKTNTPEFAIYIRTDNDLAPETVNPWDLARTSGGSSGGAAASVAAGLTTIAVGSDGGGSTRIPAALCGVVGLKPTVGSIPGTGGYIGTRRFSVAGPITTDVGDAATLWQVMHGPHASDPTWTLAPQADRAGAGRPDRPLRLRWIDDSGVPGTEADVLAATHEAAQALAAVTGGRLDEPGLSLGVDAYSESFYNIMQADRVSTGGADLLSDEAARAALTDYARHQFETGSTVTGAQYSAGVRAQMRAVDHLQGLLAGADALVTPTLGFVAPLIPQGRAALPEDARRGFVSFTFLMNFTGFPALSVPCGLVRGLPVGIQLIGRPGCEPLLLELARRFQDSVFRMPVPPLCSDIAATRENQR